MLIFFVKYLIQFNSFFSIFYSLKFRSIISLLTALFISIWIGNKFIVFLQKFNINQIVRNDGPKSHFSKRNTPTIGGVIILISIIISILIFSNLHNPYIWYVLFVFVSYGILGLIDDCCKIMQKNINGLIIRWKYFWQSIIALTIACVIYFEWNGTTTTQLVVPFLNEIMPQLGVWYIVLTYLTIVGTSNAVNLTDGLDGLAIMPTVFISTGLSILAYASSNMHIANYLHIPYLSFAGELVIVCMAIIGSCLGFLWFNSYPAQIFMGDVGSLALGGILGIITVLLRQEILFLIMGGIFLIETISVILQVVYFKLIGKKIFFMAPIHHHYELKGIPETKIVIRFWIISFINVLIGLAMINIW